MRKSVRAVLAVSLMLSTTLAGACGDKLSAFSRHPHFKDLVHSAQILVIAPAHSAGAALVADPQFQSALKKGKHKLRVVDSAAKVSTELASENFDLVVADADSISGIEQQMRSSSSSAVVIPVMDAPSKSELRAMEHRYPVVMTAGSKTGRYLDNLDDAVEIRAQRGRPVILARK